VHPNAKLINDFYSAFKRRNAVEMAACYTADVNFSDPAFPALRGEEVGAMWSMLCDRGKDLVITFGGVEADDRTGRAHWEARYTFTATGRAVVNKIQAEFRFEAGRIASHHDRFSFWGWSSQALGVSGLLLGWTPLLRKKVQGEAAKALQKYIEKSKQKGKSKD